MVHSYIDAHTCTIHLLACCLSRTRTSGIAIYLALNISNLRVLAYTSFHIVLISSTIPSHDNLALLNQPMTAYNQIKNAVVYHGANSSKI